MESKYTENGKYIKNFQLGLSSCYQLKSATRKKIEAAEQEEPLVTWNTVQLSLINLRLSVIYG